MNEIEQQIQNLEKEMADVSFWNDKVRAQEKVRELGELKGKLADLRKHDKGDAIITIFSGAGGDDAEDWTRILFEMYDKFAEKRGFSVRILHRHDNEHNGIKNTTFQVSGQGAYSLLKKESGVHRLVRISPFSAKKARHTSFAMVEVVPKFVNKEIVIPPEDVKIDFSKSGGPGGQNVNKRETAVRLTHIPTGISVHCDSERTQEANREIAFEILHGKLFTLAKEQQKKEHEGFQISKIQDAEWGNQIRSYVLHPYKLVKDHRTEVEHKDPEKVLQEGDIDIFLAS